MFWLGGAGQPARLGKLDTVHLLCISHKVLYEISGCIVAVVPNSGVIKCTLTPVFGARCTPLEPSRQVRESIAHYVEAAAPEKLMLRLGAQQLAFVAFDQERAALLDFNAVTRLERNVAGDAFVVSERDCVVLGGFY